MRFSSKFRLIILLLVFVCAAGCDQASKHIARTELEHLGSVPLPGGFGEFRLAQNPGSFLGLGDSLPEPVRAALLTVGVGLGLVGLFADLAASAPLNCYAFIGLALVWAGGTSNLIDRMTRRGYVTDFILIRVGLLHTGVFNLADVMIMIGLAVLVCVLCKQRQMRTPQSTRQE